MWLKILGSKVYGIGHNPNRNKNLFYSLNLNKEINLSILMLGIFLNYLKKLKV